MLKSQNQSGVQKYINRIIALTHPYPTTPRLAQKIYRTYGAAAIERLTENPYALARDVRGIGENTATQIAKIIETKLNTIFTPPALRNPNVPRYHYGGPGNGKLSAKEIELLKEKLRHPPADMLPTSDELLNPDCWTVPDLRLAIEKWFDVNWASDSSYRNMLKKCGLRYNRNAKAYVPATKVRFD